MFEFIRMKLFHGYVETTESKCYNLWNVDIVSLRVRDVEANLARCITFYLVYETHGTGNMCIVKVITFYR